MPEASPSTRTRHNGNQSERAFKENAADTDSLFNCLEEVRQLVAQYLIDRATSRFLDVTQHFGFARPLRNQAISLTARWTRIATRQREIGETPDSRIEINELIQGLLSTLDECERLVRAKIDARQWIHVPPGSDPQHQNPDGSFVGDLLRKRSTRRNPSTPGGRPGEVAFRTLDGLRYSPSGDSEFVLACAALELQFAQLTAVLGSNASGKTTLLRIIAADLEPSAGSPQYFPTRIDVDNCYATRNRIAYVPQVDTPWTGRMQDNLRFEAAIHGYLGAANDEWVDYVLHRLRLEDYAESTWHSLSAGYRARFALARALMADPLLLVLDEPLAHLDPVSAPQYLQDLVDLTKWMDRPVATVISSQHVHEIEAVADQVVVIDTGTVRMIDSTGGQPSSKDTHEFEIQCSLTPVQLRQALAEFQPVKIEGNLHYCSIETPDSATAADLLTHLVDLGVTIRYFRDVTHSVKRQLK